VVRHRRAIAVAIASLGLACAALAFVDAFDFADVPGGGLFGVATWLFIGASWVFRDVSSQWRTPKVTKSGR